MFYQLKEEELDRLLVIKAIKSRSMNQRAGALKLGITPRQLHILFHEAHVHKTYAQSLHRLQALKIHHETTITRWKNSL